MFNYLINNTNCSDGFDARMKTHCKKLEKESKVTFFYVNICSARASTIHLAAQWALRTRRAAPRARKSDLQLSMRDFSPEE